MIRTSPRPPRPGCSPRPHLPRTDANTKNSNVEGEYQLRSTRNPKKTQYAGKRQQKEPDRPQQGSAVRRRLSFKKGPADQLRLTAKPEPRESPPGVISKQPMTTEELALQVEYYQFPSKVRPQPRKLQKGVIQPAEGHMRRIRRIRSSDSLSFRRIDQSSCSEHDEKFKLAMDENTRLEGLKTQSLEKLCELKNIFAAEKKQYLGEIVSFQRQIYGLKGRIDQNRNELGHIFSYKAFDAMSLVINPIVEMEGENSQLRSALCPSELQQLQFESRLRKGSMGESDGKQYLTETAGPSSREEYGEIDCF